MDPKNPSAYKQLFRAAKAKLRLRVRATIVDEVDDVTSSSTEPHLQTKVAPLIDAEVEVKPIPIVRPIDLNSQAARDAFFAHLASIAKRREAERPKEEVPAPVATTAWQVYCNNCDKPMKDTHYHCSICDDGDYDLCEECVSTGKVCPGEAHWLIKRCVKDGKVVNSTTQMLSRKQSEVVTKKQAIALTKTVTEIQSVAGKTEEMPGAFHVESKSETLAPQSKRTCNNCVAGEFRDCGQQVKMLTEPQFCQRRTWSLAMSVRTSTFACLAMFRTSMAIIRRTHSSLFVRRRR